MSLNWNRVWAIARWEFIQKVRSKGFIASLLLTPVLIVAFSVVPTLLADRQPDETKAVGVIDQTGALYQELRSVMESTIKLPNGQPRYLLANYLAAGRPVDTAIAMADRDALEGVTEGTLVIEDSAGTKKAVYRSPNPSNIQLVSQFGKVLDQIELHHDLRAIGVDTAAYARIASDVDISTVKVTEPGSGESGSFLMTFFLSYAGVILLMILVMTTGQTLVRSLVEEKSNRIMELLVGSSRPYELMWGKLFGLSGLGVAQIGSWVILGLGAVTLFAVPAGVSSSLKEVYALLPLILLYIILGYIFYAGIFIAMGSLVTTEQEAQVMTSYLVMLLVAPVAFSFAVIQQPDAGYVRALSYLPILTPQLMMIRTVTKTPAPWEIAATIGVMVVATVLVVWAAGKIFRTAILLYGKRPSAGEILRWIRRNDA